MNYIIREIRDTEIEILEEFLYIKSYEILALEQQ